MDINYIVLIAIVLIAIPFVIQKKKNTNKDTNSATDNCASTVEDDTFLLGEYQTNIWKLGQETINEIQGHPSESDFDKKDTLLKRATSLKKDGDIDKSIKTIDKAISHCKCFDAIYKKAYYLQIDKQYDKAWKTLDNYRMEISSLFVDSNNWGPARRILQLLNDVESGSIKILKGEKKYKDLAYYLPGSVYLELVFYTIAHSSTESFENICNRYTEINLSENINKSFKDIDRSRYDEEFRSFLLSRKEDLKQLYKASIMLEGSGNREEYAYVKKTEKLNAQATELMKSLYYGQISINDKCSVHLIG